MQARSSLCHAFVDSLRVPRSGLDEVQLAARLTAVIADARAAWPAVTVGDERFVSYLATRIPEDGPVLSGIDRLRTTDLWLACACGDLDPDALAAFEGAYGSEINIALASLGVPPHVADEARQTVRMRLFVAAPGVQPVIGRYGGRGDLRAWVRATSVRAAIDILRGASKEVPTDNVGLDDPTPAFDPVLSELRERYGAGFKQAFSEAFAALSRRDRSILRYRFVDGLDIDGIGAIYRVHRATAARWLQRIRAELSNDTRARLAAQLAVPSTELDSILRFIGSELDVSISSALRR